MDVKNDRVTLKRVGPPVAAGVLAPLAVLEVLPLQGAPLAIGLLVALCATVPLAVCVRHPLTVAVLTTAGTVLSTWFLDLPSIAGAVASLVAWGVVAVGRWTDRRAANAARESARDEMERSLVRYTALGERARIARELHDVVAHHVSMISVQAETARLTTPGMPEEGARRLLAIGETARTALTEMRRLLGVLREEGEDTARAPQPGLDQLLDLIDTDRTTGAGRTRLIVSGLPSPLSPGAELAAYRVVQESLTNARKYAPGAAVDVEVERTPDGLRLRIRDNGPGPAGVAPGLGLLGMRERVTAVGGTLHTGPAPSGGFLVEALIPGDPG